AAAAADPRPGTPGATAAAAKAPAPAYAPAAASTTPSAAPTTPATTNPGPPKGATMTTVFPSSPDRALSVRQPWAEAIIGHGKTIENRRWDTGWRGSLLIHAAKATPTPDNELLAAALAGQPVDGSVR